MIIKEFNNIDEIQKYYDENTSTYIFKENVGYIELVKFNFDLNTKANIKALNIYACNIKALNINALNIYACDIDVNDIKAHDINALNINANNISYYAVCFAYDNIKCKSIKGRKYNAKHFVLDGTLEIEDE